MAFSATSPCASLTLAGASAGGPVIGALLARRDLADRVRSVVAIDGLYSGEGAFAAWLDGATAGRRGAS